MSILSFMRNWLTVQPPTIAIGRPDVPSGERVEEGDVLALSAAYACVRLLAGTGASLPAMIFAAAEGDDGIRVPTRAHPLYRLLHDSPNDEQTAYDFFEGLWASLDLKGNFVALKEVIGGRVTALLPMRWDQTRVYRRRDGSIAYNWRDKTYSADEIVHIRGFGGDALGGLSTIAVAASSFGLAKAINRSAGAVFRNGIRTQVAMVSERDLTPEQMNDTRTLIDEKYTGAMNAGRPMLLNNGFKAVPLSMNPEDAQMLESRGFSVADICRFFGVPPHMVGHTEKSSSWGTGVSEMTLSFLKFTLRPRLERIEQSLEKQLLTAEDRARGVRIEFNVEGLLRAASKERSEFYGAAVRDGWMSRNEVRRKENLPPVAGGDTITVQMQQVPLGQSPTPQPSA